MRKILILCLTFAAVSYGSQRVVVAELFRRVTCPYCPYASEAITRLKNEVGDSLTVIAYHTSAAFTNSDAVGRANFYGISGVPTLWMDGVGSFVGGGSGNYSQYRGYFNWRKTVEPQVEITLFGNYNQSTGQGSATAKFENITADTIIGTCQFVICQRDTPYAWYWLDSLYFIERKMYPNYNGTPVTIAPSETVEVTQSFTVQQDWERDDCYLTVFVQKTGWPTEITQAAEVDLLNLGIEEGESDKKISLQRVNPTPNPCIDGTKFFFNLPAGTEYYINIFDVTGRHVRTLRGISSGNQESIKWHCRDDTGSQVGSGVYLYHFESKTLKSTGKIVVR